MRKASNPPPADLKKPSPPPPPPNNLSADLQFVKGSHPAPVSARAKAESQCIVEVGELLEMYFLHLRATDELPNLKNAVRAANEFLEATE